MAAVVARPADDPVCATGRGMDLAGKRASGFRLSLCLCRCLSFRSVRRQRQWTSTGRANEHHRTWIHADESAAGSCRSRGGSGSGRNE